MEWFEPILIIAIIAFVGIIFFRHFRSEYRGAKRAIKTGQCSCKGCAGCHMSCSKAQK